MDKLETSDNLKEIEEEIDKLGLEFVALIKEKDKSSKNLIEKSKVYAEICKKCYEWVKINPSFSKYFDKLETSNTRNANEKEFEYHFGYSQELLEGILKTAETFKLDLENSSFIKKLTVTVFHDIKKAYFSNEKGITDGNKNSKDISKLEECFNDEFESPKLKEAVISGGFITEKQYNKLLKYKNQFKNMQSLDEPYSDNDSDDNLLNEYIPADKSYGQYRYDKRAEILDKILSLQNILYKSSRPNSKKNKALAYTFIVVKSLITFPESEIKKQCKKYTFINEDAVLHFKKSNKEITLKSYTEYTGGNHIKKYIDEFINFAKEDKDLRMYQELLDLVY